MALKPAKNTQLRASSFAAQRNLFFNNKLADDNKTPKALIKPKAQPKAMLKGKKWPKTLKTKKMNCQMNKKELMNFFIRNLANLST